MQFLVQRPIPSYISSLPAQVLATPFGQAMLPLINSLESQLRHGPLGDGGMPTHSGHSAVHTHLRDPLPAHAHMSVPHQEPATAALDHVKSPLMSLRGGENMLPQLRTLSGSSEVLCTSL